MSVSRIWPKSTEPLANRMLWIKCTTRWVATTESLGTESRSSKSTNCPRINSESKSPDVYSTKTLVSLPFLLGKRTSDLLNLSTETISPKTDPLLSKLESQLRSEIKNISYNFFSFNFLL